MNKENFNKTHLLTGLAGIALGGLAVWACTGWSFRGDRDDFRRDERIPQNMHQMSNGQMMQNGAAMQGNDMQGIMMDMTAGIQGKAGKDLEKAFLSEMVPHHQGAIDMAKMLLASTSTPENLRNFAQQIVDAQSKEITQMNEWLKNY
jgi:uncharacterized protein (DUF305 family)